MAENCRFQRNCKMKIANWLALTGSREASMRPRRNSLIVLILAVAPAMAQSGQLAPAVRDFVKVQAPIVTLQHVRVIDGTGAASRLDQTLIIEAGKIRSVGDAASIAARAGHPLFDLNVSPVFPGLEERQEHMSYPARGGPPPMYPEHATSFPRLYLAGGVTTIRTTGSVEPYTDLAIKHDIDE